MGKNSRMTCESCQVVKDLAETVMVMECLLESLYEDPAVGPLLQRKVKEARKGLQQELTKRVG